MSLSRRDLLAAGAALGATTVLAALDRTHDRAHAAAEGALKLQLFTSDDNGFLVNSVILAGEKDAIVVDAQFSMANAHRLVAELLSTGKRLTTVYVTHPHPDHYFGLEVVRAAFPDARIVAIPAVAPSRAARTVVAPSAAPAASRSRRVIDMTFCSLISL